MNLIGRDYCGFKFVTCAVVGCNGFAAIQIDAEIPLCLHFEVCFSNLILPRQKFLKTLSQKFLLSFVSWTDVRRNPQCPSIFQLTFKLTD